jgi:hypothetical protein
LTSATPDPELFTHNLEAIKDILILRHKFPLKPADVTVISRIFAEFFKAGPTLEYDVTITPDIGTPTYEELMVATDASGQNRSFLASESHYGAVRDMQARNLIVPLVGNFAGPKAILAVAGFLKARKASVNVFYLSNVEYYLFLQEDNWSRFYSNISALPLNSSSTLIRSVLIGPDSRFTGRMGFAMVSSSMQETIDAFAQRRIRTYQDILELSSQ